MRLTVLGGCGAWPTSGQACSGYLVEQEDYRVLIDPGYATLPRLLDFVPVDQVDAVLVSHGHPDHCADLNPLLRARALQNHPPPALPVYSLPGALNAVLALDEPRMLADSLVLHEFTGGECFDLGPFEVDTRLLPHFVPNAGIRLSADGAVLAYTGDTGPSPVVVELARGVDVLVAEATFVERVPDPDAAYLTSALQAGRQAAEAGVAHLVLTHLWPGTDPVQARRAAERTYGGRIDVARSGLVVEP